MTLSKKLNYLRTSKKLTQQEVANYLQITRQGYSNYERAEREPDVRILIALSKLYNVSVDYILNLTPLPFVVDENYDFNKKINLIYPKKN